MSGPSKISALASEITVKRLSHEAWDPSKIFTLASVIIYGTNIFPSTTVKDFKVKVLKVQNGPLKIVILLKEESNRFWFLILK
jgi:hypothetical protein